MKNEKKLEFFRHSGIFEGLLFINNWQNKYIMRNLFRLVEKHIRVNVSLSVYDKMNVNNSVRFDSSFVHTFLPESVRVFIQQTGNKNKCVFLLDKF